MVCVMWSLRAVVVCALFTYTGDSEKSPQKNSNSVESHDITGQFTSPSRGASICPQVVCAEYLM